MTAAALLVLLFPAISHFLYPSFITANQKEAATEQQAKETYIPVSNSVKVVLLREMSDHKRRRIIVDDEVDNDDDLDDRERFVNVNNETQDDDNESIGSNPDIDEDDNEDEGEGEDLAETWGK